MQAESTSSPGSTQQSNAADGFSNDRFGKSGFDAIGEEISRFLRPTPPPPLPSTSRRLMIVSRVGDLHPRTTANYR